MTERVKLTEAQRELLEVMALRGSAHCIQMEPIWSIVQRGLAKRAAGDRYRITPAGRQALKDQDTNHD